MSHDLRPVKPPPFRHLLVSIILTLLTLLPPLPIVAQTVSDAIVDDPAQLEPGEVMRMTEGEIRQLAFSPDEAILAVATSAGLWLYSPDEESNGALLDEAAVQALWWSADSNLLAALLDDGVIQIWLVGERTLLTSVEGNNGVSSSLAWSPDGGQIALGTVDGAISIWDVGQEAELETLEGHTARITALHWTTDGSQIISAAEDGSLRVWAVEVAAAPTPTQTPTPEPIAVGSAIVAVETLNVRSGPSTTFERIAQVKRGEELTILGQVNNCAWLQVTTAAIPRGWVAGGAQFVTLETDCASISAPSSPSALTATPTPAADDLLPAATLPTPSLPAPTATVALTESVAAPTPAAPTDPFPPDQGCYLFQNQLGPELTITFTSTDGTINLTFTVPAGQELPYCFIPGSYTYTIDAPPPWADINGDLTVEAGARYMFPIRPQ